VCRTVRNCLGCHHCRAQVARPSGLFNVSSEVMIPVAAGCCAGNTFNILTHGVKISQPSRQIC
jgi:hypothetical protein